MLHEKIITFTVPMLQPAGSTQRLNFQMPSNVRKVTGIMLSADRTGVGTENVFYTSLQANNDTEQIFSGEVRVPNLSTFKGNFGFVDCTIEPKPNSVFTGYATTLSCATTYNAKYCFRVEEEV